MALVLKYGSLRLRPWRQEDAGALVAAHRDPDLRKWLNGIVDSHDEALRWIEEGEEGWADGSFFRFAVLDGEPGRDGALLGHAVLKCEGDDPGTGEVGYWTAPAARGRGVASGAVDAVTEWAFAALDVERLELLHAAPNSASCRVAEKSGFALHSELPPLPPAYPHPGHLHLRLAP
ncbi:GNAT family N-acetyltransferase [Streptomyces boncukensis]|uniref:GNAT family N-acetyltransferase n=1 Tax=Streptomyces boncukensis TaxID=2711219 RepID=A0A6G4X5A2_9ACTN|nr:GNAT family N-acetyltransferase [Streptomyces boncukensis]NGO72027.1 GNAT family N-acetyltransferase [Streptomyces boncukensis]